MNELAERAVYVFGKNFAAVYEQDSEWTRRFRAGDDSTIEELVRRACQEVGISFEEYEEAVLSNPHLEKLQSKIINDVVLSDLIPPTQP